MHTSAHLAHIVDKQNRISPMFVVFVDVEKYSLRRTVNQIAVIDALTACMTEALAEVSRKYISYAQANDLNFDTDIIKLPTGDGAAIIFTFSGIHDIHLEFAKQLLFSTNKLNTISSCEKFDSQGWCNCHHNFNITIGLSDGKGIIYTDVNKNYNVAGAVVNMAARVMGTAERNQIMLTQDAYTQLIEMDKDTQLIDRFVSYERQIKHGIKMTVYQYTDPSADYINSSPPTQLVYEERMKKVIESMTRAGFPDITADKESAINYAEGMVKILGGLGGQLIPETSVRRGLPSATLDQQPGEPDDPDNPK